MPLFERIITRAQTRLPKKTTTSTTTSTPDEPCSPRYGWCLLLLLAGERSSGAAEGGDDDSALDQADVAYSANSFMAVVKPVTLCMTLSAFITVSLYSDAEGATNRCVCACTSKRAYEVHAPPPHSVWLPQESCLGSVARRSHVRKTIVPIHAPISVEWAGWLATHLQEYPHDLKAMPLFRRSRGGCSALSVYEVYDESAANLDPSSVRLGKSLVNAFMIVLVLAGKRWRE